MYLSEGVHSECDDKAPAPVLTDPPWFAGRNHQVVCGYAFTMFVCQDSGTLLGCGFNNNGRVGICDEESTWEVSTSPLHHEMLSTVGLCLYDFALRLSALRSTSALIF